MLNISGRKTRLYLSGLLTVLITLGIFVVLPSCGPRSDVNTPEAYIENGIQWAYGSVKVTYLDVPGGATVERTSGVQGVDSYKLYGSILAHTAGGSGKRDIAYVDFHPRDSKLLAYAYGLNFRKRSGRSDTVDVYVQLKKAGRSKNERSFFIGSADFQPNNSFANLTLADGLYLSLISEGVYIGQWAFHFPNARTIINVPWQGVCSSRVSQMPGQNPFQNAKQKIVCRPIPAQIDLCGGKPSQTGCRPRAPQNPVNFIESGATTDMNTVEEEENVFTFPETTNEGKFTFVSRNIYADDDDNPQLCTQKFLAVARTLGEQVNAACTLKPAPAYPTNGKLTCAVTVSFNNPSTYLERVCNITAVFKGTPLETQKVQVLEQ